MPRADNARGFTLTDLLVSIAVAMMVGLTVLPRFAARTREEENRIRCALNLRQLGLAMKLYANEQVRTSAYPRTRYDPKTADKPTFYTHPEAADPFGAAGPDFNDVTASMWLLPRDEDITPSLFVCPSAGTKPVVYPQGMNVTNFSNFVSAEELSYSMQNPFPTKEAVQNGFKFTDDLPSEFAIMADINPGSPEVLTVKPTDAPALQRKANSPNHGFEGQNVLYADGHVEWLTTVFVGMPGGDVNHSADNIYAHRSSDLADSRKNPGKSSGIIGSPGDASDSVLLPTWDARIKFPTIDLGAPGVGMNKPATRPATGPAFVPNPR